jgi:hypothetical protein
VVDRDIPLKEGLAASMRSIRGGVGDPMRRRLRKHVRSESGHALIPAELREDDGTQRDAEEKIKQIRAGRLFPDPAETGSNGSRH